MKTVSARVEDWIAEKIEEKGRPSDVIRTALLAYLSNEVGICGKMYANIITFLSSKPFFDSLEAAYTEFSTLIKKMKKFYPRYKFNIKEFIETENKAYSFIYDNILYDYLDALNKLLESFKIDKGSYREYDEILNKKIKDVKDAISVLEKIKNSWGYKAMSDSHLQYLDVILGSDDELKNEILREMIYVHYNIFYNMTLDELLEFFDYAESMPEAHLQLIKNLCIKKDPRINEQVCSEYSRAEDEVRSYDVPKMYGLSDDKIAKIKEVLLGQDRVAIPFEDNISRGVIGLRLLEITDSYLWKIFNGKSAVIFITEFSAMLLDNAKKICTP
ncbi:hypothetical protein [Saccharolobus caldissimus]|uniref:Uncharacterized protein n=1 Tax=Saccharolobus caldissimus TaxID=1702097 RepID=A0AAQ4CNS6_9CREN|nr:hypothetical protein [Saccharolobus caldissimus]BDB97457.1 hypothetical protein SACC_04740 [Saccharolobus caldissimus]